MKVSSIAGKVLNSFSPVARPKYHSKFWGNHFIAFFIYMMVLSKNQEGVEV